MTVVVDSSIAVSWLMPDETSNEAERAMRLVQAYGMTVPALFPYEVHNVLVVNERRGRLPNGLVEDLLKRLAAIPMDVDDGFDSAVLLTVARNHRLTVYDAAYLELARRLGAPLATLDRKLAEAALAAGVALA